MKAYTKTIYRSIKHNLGRIISIVFIIMIGITCYAGIGTLSSTLKTSFNEFFNSISLSDLNIKSSDEENPGFQSEDLLSFKNDAKVESILPFTSFDFDSFGYNTRLYLFENTMNFERMNLNKLELIEGKYPSESNEVLIEQSSNNILNDYQVGDEIKINLFDALGISYTIKARVSGIVQNPLVFSKDGDVNLITQEPLELMIYSHKSLLPSLIAESIPITDIYLKLKNNEPHNYFSSKYKEFIEENVSYFEERFKDKKYAYLSISENVSFIIMNEYCDKVDIIGIVIPIFFVIVAALVVLTTMSRMIDEDRSEIACYSSLGVSNAKIRFKYMFFCGVFTVLGSILGMTLGLTLLPTIIYPGFKAILFLPPRIWYVNVIPGIIATLIITIVSMSITFYAINKDLKVNPSELMLPKSPKVGKKIWLEKIPPIWKKLPFRFKSSFRNIFRNKKHLIMTVISVAGSTMIVMAGFSLLDVVNYSSDVSVEGLKDTITPISVLIIILALLLTIFVIYNLTNMNIGERIREIATLDVLGYHDNEVCMYIYREISLMATMGIILGIPLGTLLIWFLLEYLNFGSVLDVRWYTYFVSAGLVVFFILIVDLLLIKKIIKIDMTTSLKSVD